MAVICEKCHKRTASVYMEKIINGQKTEYNLCLECAESLENNASLDDLLKNFMNMMFTTGSPYAKGETNSTSAVGCEKCGLTYEEFRQVNKFGCDNCYNTFRNQLDLIFKNIQKSSVHTGKYPSRVDGEIAFERKLNDLKSELNKAVEGEEYEQAAIFRDKIKELNESVKEDVKEDKSS